MSRVGKLPVNIPDNIKVSITDDVITFDSGKFKKIYRVSHGVKVDYINKQIRFKIADGYSADTSTFVGMNRSNVKNIVIGLQTGFRTTLEINGVGYKALVDNRLLILTLGFSHEIFYALPDGVDASFEKPNLIILSGSDNVLVGQTAAEIISFRRPEPYKGKGVKVFGKRILRKEGKKK